MRIKLGIIIGLLVLAAGCSPTYYVDSPRQCPATYKGEDVTYLTRTDGRYECVTHHRGGVTKAVPVGEKQEDYSVVFLVVLAAGIGVSYRFVSKRRDERAASQKAAFDERRKESEARSERNLQEWFETEYPNFDPSTYARTLIRADELEVGDLILISGNGSSSWIEAPDTMDLEALGHQWFVMVTESSSAGSWRYVRSIHVDGPLAGQRPLGGASLTAGRNEREIFAYVKPRT